MSKPPRPVTVLGAGLAGCEEAWQLAKRDIPVRLLDMKPGHKSPAHQSELLAELVCSNSLKSDRTQNASGLLKEEMRRLGSFLEAADKSRVAAGAPWRVDRDCSPGFSRKMRSHPGWGWRGAADGLPEPLPSPPQGLSPRVAFT